VHPSLPIAPLIGQAAAGGSASQHAGLQMPVHALRTPACGADTGPTNGFAAPLSPRALAHFDVGAAVRL
jgi:hypothetical protein